MWCIVNLPNGTQQAVKWDPKAMGQECLEKVCKALGIICEMEYFGLEHWTPNRKESRTREWINLRNRLTHDGSSGSSSIQLMLALRVKFWVPVHFILQESVRNLFYMQAKVDLLEGRLNARDWSNAAKLSALLCQADGIRYNESSLKSKCPIRMKKEQELICQQSREEKKEKKDKEYVLSFKKRRLSKQKSIEKIDNPIHHPAVHLSHIPMNRNDDSNISSTSASSASSSSSSSPPPPVPPVPSTSTSSSDGGISMAASSSTSSSHSSTSRSTNKVSNGNSSISNTNTTTTPNTNATHQDATCLENSYQTSLLRIYEDYIIQPTDTTSAMPDDFLREIAIEHGKLATLQMTPKSAKYWLLQEIQDLPGYGEEVFNGMLNENSVRCDITVGAHGIIVCTGDDKKNIPFSAIAAAKSFRRSFKLEYVDDHNDRKDLDIKLPKNNLAGGLYRSITERHAFYVCDKVRGVVTNQFTRDLKGTIASMFKDDTKLGKRYVFDIQRTCREVHDQARRTLHERGIEITAQATNNVDDIARYFPMTSSIKATAAAAAGGGDDNNCGGSSSGSSGVVSFSRCTNGGDPLGNINRAAIIASGCISVAGKVDLAIREKEEREAAIERCVDTRISEAMTCKICMDRAINTMFNPCCHVMACSQCAARCTNCPNCRVKISSVVKIYLPPELRTNQFANSCNTLDTDQTNRDECTDGEHHINATTILTPKITTAA